VVSPQDMPMNERIGYDNTNYLPNCSQNSAPYASAPIHNSTSYVTPNSSRINENSARYANGNTHDSASYVAHSSSRINERWVNDNTHDSTSYVTINSNRINENSAKCKKAIDCDSASYATSSSSQIDEDLAHARNPYGSSKWKVPAYHRPYPLHIDYLKTLDGWWVPDFYEFSSEDDKTVV
jgi:hypothetical protein